MPLLLLMVLPGMFIFDLIPQIFGFSGLEKWYIKKYKKEGDFLIFAFYVPFFFLCSLILYLIYK